MTNGVTEKALAEPIGRMTILWNDCQSIIFMMFFRLLGVDLLKAEAVFFTLKNDGAQRDITIALLHPNIHISTALQERATKAINAFGKIAGRRNDFIHAMWHLPDGSETPAVWLDARKSLSGKDSVEEIGNLISELGKVFVQLRQVHEQITAVTPRPPSALAQPREEPLRLQTSQRPVRRRLS